MYAPTVRARTLLAPSLSLIGFVLIACAPRPKAPPTPASPTSSVPTVPSTAAPTTTATTTPTAGWTIPTLPIPGFTGSPRQAMIGRWNVVGVDGKAIATTPGMATDPFDPASYAAGTQVNFTADTVTIERAGLTMLSRPYKVVGELPPIRVTIDAGYGPSNLDMSFDGTCLWSMPSTPPHVLALQRAP